MLFGKVPLLNFTSSNYDMFIFLPQIITRIINDFTTFQTALRSLHIVSHGDP